MISKFNIYNKSILMQILIWQLSNNSLKALLTMIQRESWDTDIWNAWNLVIALVPKYGK